MKKLLATLCVLSFVTGVSVSAATSSDTTYTESFIKKHTQKIVDTEKKATNKVNDAKAKQKAQKEALLNKVVENGK